MIRTDATFLRAVEDAVVRVERGTSAEIVVIAAQRSGNYRDVALALGAGAAWVILAALAVSPVVFSALWTVVDVAIVFGATTWIAHRWPSLLARLVPASRKKRQCLEAARTAFLEESVDRTARRTGVLVYLSLLEHRVVVIPDAGVLGSVPLGDLCAVRWGAGAENESLSTLDAFVAGLGALGAVLARDLPAQAANPNERPDSPRIRG